jgi:CheY-like chemotaxis protein
LQPIKHIPELDLFTTRRVVVVEGDREAAEMLHTFFRLMELECSLVAPDSEAASTVRRLRPNVVILDLDLPDLRALEIARDLRQPRLPPPIIFVTEREPLHIPLDAPAIQKPRDRFEDLLALFELVLTLC